MPEYLSPGVYVEEVDTGNKPIEGVGTSTVGFYGPCERGPDDRPRFVDSFTAFRRMYGTYVPNTHLARGIEGFFQNGGKRCFVMRVASGDPAVRSSTLDIGTMRVIAIGPGDWGDRVRAKVTDASLADPALFKLTLMYFEPSMTVPAPFVDPTHPGNRNDPNRAPEPTILEIFDNLSADPTSTSFYERRVNNYSDLVTLEQLPAGVRPPNNAPNNDQAPIAGQPPPLAGGVNGPALVAADYIGVANPEPGMGRGLAALEGIDEIAILCCPDEHAFFPAISQAMVGQCERLMDRFAILSAPQAPVALAGHRPSVISRYGAYYYPWLMIDDAATGRELEIPPSGHMAGIYARTDNERGVHKAPANERIREIKRLQFQVTRGQQDILNPRGVNVLRYFEGRGDLVWGARTTTDDPDWKYINVRRLFIFVEESIDEGTQWVVFEPNDEDLWARVRRSVSDFLRGLWSDGMLMGVTAEEAYFVRCDRTTMTQADIENGRLIVEVGIAPVRPAEFVIFRIGQWSGGSEVEEQ